MLTTGLGQNCCAYHRVRAELLCLFKNIIRKSYVWYSDTDKLALWKMLTQMDKTNVVFHVWMISLFIFVVGVMYVFENCIMKSFWHLSKNIFLALSLGKKSVKLQSWKIFHFTILCWL